MKSRPKISSVIENLADPFLVLGIFVLFLIPVITVFNLTPIRLTQPKDDSVLGVAETDMLKIEENTKTSDGILLSEFEQLNENSYKFIITQNAHTLGSYKNLIFKAENISDEDKVIKISSQHEITDPGTKVSLSTGKKEYVLLGEDGSIFPASIYIKPDEKLEFSLLIESPFDVNFASTITLTVFTD